MYDIVYPLTSAGRWFCTRSSNGVSTSWLTHGTWKEAQGKGFDVHHHLGHIQARQKATLRFKETVGTQYTRQYIVGTLALGHAVLGGNVWSHHIYLYHMNTRGGV